MQSGPKLKFILVAGLVIVGITYLQNQATLQQEKYNRLQQQIDELTEIYNQTVQDLDEACEENRVLMQDLHEALVHIESVEKRNAELETILFNQRQTYRHAVALKGSTMPVLTPSSFTAKQYERAWIRLGAHGLRGTGEALAGAEARYGVNSLVLGAIAYVESAGGMSKIAREKNNLFGLGAFDYNPYYSAYYFSTKGESIYYAANLLRNSYLSRSSRNYRGDNLQAIGIRYASDPRWAEKVGRVMSRIARAAIPEGR